MNGSTVRCMQGPAAERGFLSEKKNEPFLAGNRDKLNYNIDKSSANSIKVCLGSLPISERGSLFSR